MREPSFFAEEQAKISGTNLKTIAQFLWYLKKSEEKQKIQMLANGVKNLRDVQLMVKVTSHLLVDMQKSEKKRKTQTLMEGLKEFRDFQQSKMMWGSLSHDSGWFIGYETKEGKKTVLEKRNEGKRKLGEIQRIPKGEISMGAIVNEELALILFPEGRLIRTIPFKKLQHVLHWGGTLAKAHHIESYTKEIAHDLSHSSTEHTLQLRDSKSHPTPSKKEFSDFEKMTQHSINVSNDKFEALAKDTEPFLDTQQIKTSLEYAKQDVIVFNDLHSEAQRYQETLKEKWQQFLQSQGGVLVLKALGNVTEHLHQGQIEMGALALQKKSVTTFTHDYNEHVESLKAAGEWKGMFHVPVSKQDWNQGVFAYKSLQENLHKVQVFLMGYRKSQEKLETLLQKREERLVFCEQMRSKQEELDKKIQKEQKHLLSHRSKTIKALVHLSTFVKAVASFGDLFSLPDLEIPSHFLDIGKTSQLELQEGEIGKYKKILETGAKVHEQISLVQHSTQQEMFSIQQKQQYEWQSLLNFTQEGLAPQECRKMLASNLEKIEGSLKKKELEKESLAQEKNKLEEQKKNIQQKIDALKDHGVDHHHRERKLHKYEQQVYQLTIASEQKEQRLDLLQQDLQGLSEIKQEHEEAVQREEDLGEMKDAIYQKILEENQEFFSTDERGQEFRFAAKKGWTQYHFARQEERLLVWNGFGSFQSLFEEIGRFGAFHKNASVTYCAKKVAVGAALASQCYNLWDAFKAFQMGQELLHQSIKMAQKKDAEATLFDAIPLMGLSLFVGSYVTPGMQLATFSLSLLRMSQQLFGEEKTFFQEEAFYQLQTFLRGFSESMHQQMQTLDLHLSKNHAETMKELVRISQEAHTFYADLKESLLVSERNIVKEIRNKHDLKCLLRIQDVENKLRSKGEAIAQHLAQLAQGEKREALQKKLIRHISKGFSMNLNEVNGGILTSRNGVNCLVEIECAIDHPEIFSGMIGHLTHFSDPVPSLFLLRTLVDFSAILEQEEIKDADAWEEIQKKLNAQQAVLDGLAGHVDFYTTSVQSNQRDFFDDYERKIEAGKEKETEWIRLSIAKSLDDALKEAKGSCVPSRQLDIVRLLQQQILPKKTSEPLRDTFLGTAISIPFVTSVATVASLAFPPMILPVCITAATVQTIVTGGLFCKNKWTASYREQQSSFFKEDSPLSFVGKIRQNWLCDAVSLMAHLSVDKKGKIETSIVFPGPCFALSHPVEDLKKEKNYLFHATCLQKNSGGHKSLKIQSDSIYFERDLEILYDHFSQKKMDECIRQKEQLQENYVDFLFNFYKKENVDLKNNPFFFLLSEGQVVPCSNSSLLPLIFPQKILDFCASLIQDVRLMARIEGTYVIFPQYDFQWHSERNIWILTLSYAAFSESTHEVQSLICFEVATFDPITVDLMRSKQNNLHLFLLQTMYTDFPYRMGEEKNWLGMPGESTILPEKTADGEEWSIAIEESFPGLFSIWQTTPEKGVAFDHAIYTKQQANSLCNLTNGLEDVDQKLLYSLLPSLRFEALALRKSLQQNRKCKEDLKNLHQKYQILTALSSFATSCSKVEIQGALFELGGIFPIETMEDYLTFRECYLLLKQEKKGVSFPFTDFVHKYPNPMLQSVNQILNRETSKEKKP